MKQRRLVEKHSVPGKFQDADVTAGMSYCVISASSPSCRRSCSFYSDRSVSVKTMRWHDAADKGPCSAKISSSVAAVRADVVAVTQASETQAHPGGRPSR